MDSSAGLLIVAMTLAASAGTDATTRRMPSTTAMASTQPRGGAIVAPPRRNVAGRRFPLRHGVVYVPDFFDADKAPATNVVIWLHGAAWCVEQTFYDARKNAVLVTISVPDYSSAFRDPDAGPQLLHDIAATLIREKVTGKPLGRICLGSFSGGHAGVRELLRNEAFRKRLTDVVLADSLHAPRLKGSADQLDPEAMAPFVTWARDAAEGKGTLWFSHIYPPEERYRSNTTTLAASCLIERVGAKRVPASSRNSRGARLLYRADQGGFHVLGYSGMTNQDHFDHLYAASDLLRQTSLDSGSDNP